MIVVDTSALIAYLGSEAQADVIKDVLSEQDAVLMSAGSLVEFLIVTNARQSLEVARDLVEGFAIEIVSVTADLAFAAGEAHALYGRPYHKARLNYGDCFAYALAKSRDLPLLFVGDDFRRTDVKRAID